ncbi:MAG: hypothetical protein IPL40_08080 [Proteobacteria bacterium]|nr:hypothetical protein [Pseudomonadota bacterium]
MLAPRSLLLSSSTRLRVLALTLALGLATLAPHTAGATPSEHTAVLGVDAALAPRRSEAAAGASAWRGLLRSMLLSKGGRLPRVLRPLADRMAAGHLRSALATQPLEARERVIVMPSLSLRPEELDTPHGLETRQLPQAVALAASGKEVLFVSSKPVPRVVQDYYLGLLADGDAVRRRLHFLSPQQGGTQALAQTILGQPELLEQLHDFARGGSTVLETYNATVNEWLVALALDAPLNGLLPHQTSWGSKHGGFALIDAAGVPRLPSTRVARDVLELAPMIEALSRQTPEADAWMLKHCVSSCGKGNAAFALPEGFERATSKGERLALLRDALSAGRAELANTATDWSTYSAEARNVGIVAEQLVDAIRAPSFQGIVHPDGAVEALSTHLQLFIDPADPKAFATRGSRYRGALFPAPAADRDALQQSGLAIGEELARRGIFGPYGQDAVVSERPAGLLQHALEINLRTVGPMPARRGLEAWVPGRYDVKRGEWLSQATGRPTSYLTADRATSDLSLLQGLSPDEVIGRVARAGLAFDHRREQGIVLHMLTMPSVNGQLGMTAIAPNPDEAQRLFEAGVEALVKD